MSRAIAAILILTACGAAPAREPAARSERSVREICEAVMLRTRECGELYVPALLRTRARYDQPPGITARYEAEGEEVLLPIAREEFARDWSDEGIDAHCDRLEAMPEHRREAIAARDATCLPIAECAAFVDCNMALLERRWE